MSKLKAILFKPKWQHKDPRIRARSVALSEDPQLAEALPGIARTDPDATVRLSALRRVHDLAILMAAAEGDRDGQIREYAGRTIRTMVVGLHEHSPPMDQRLACFRKLQDQELAEYLAVECQDAEIRAEALKQVERPALLGNIAINDPDPELRRYAAEHVHQLSTLERIAREVRRKDKKLYRAINQRIEQARLDAGDPDAVRHKAEEISAAAEELARSAAPGTEKQQQVEALRTAWDQLASPPPDLAARFLGACGIVETALHGKDPATAKSSELQRLLAEVTARLEARDLELTQHTLESAQGLAGNPAGLDADQRQSLDAAISRLVALRDELLEAQEPSAELTALCESAEKVRLKKARPSLPAKMQKDWDRTWRALSEHKPADQLLAKRFQAALQRITDHLDQQLQQREQAAGQLGQRLETLEAMLDKGDLAHAVEAKKAFLNTRDLAGHAPITDDADFKSRVSTAQGRLRELRDWQHWANDKIRTELCEEAESVLGSGMHPDAMAEKIKGLNKRWRELEKSEHLPGDDPRRPANPGLWRRFRAACDKAFEPAKPFFEKRAEIRDRKLAELKEICRETEALAQDRECEDWPLLEKAIGKARRSLRELPKIPPKERGPLSRRLREAANGIEGHLGGYYEIVERRKGRLIEEMQALVEESDLDKAIAGAKDLQVRWKQAGRLRRRRDQALWKAFRGAADQVFARLDEQRSEERADRDSKTQQLDAVLDDMRSLLTLDTEAMAQAEGRLHQLQGRWREVGWSPRRAESDYDNLSRRIQDAVTAARKSLAADQRKSLRKLALLCRQHETARLAGQESGTGSLAEALSQAGESVPEALRSRCQWVLDADVSPKDPDQAASELQDLCIRMEFLAGVKSPEEFHQQRMEYQVQRLSEHMSSGDPMTAAEEADLLENTWLGIGPLPAEQAEALDQRFIRALEAFDRER